MLDGDAEAEGKPISASATSSIRATIAGCSGPIDDSGSEFYTLRVRDLDRQADLADHVPDTGGGGVWSADNDGFFYTRSTPTTARRRLSFIASAPTSRRTGWSTRSPTPASS